MENASKGLLIAGGMLLALIVLSLLVYMLSATGRFNEAISERKATEELAAYNAKFEAYHKSRLYGTDVITVVNKAIEHNTKMQANSIADPYYMNIKIRIKPNQNFTTTIIREDKTTNPSTETRITDVNTLDSNIRSKLGITPGVFNSYLTTGAAAVTYELGTWQGNNFVANSNFTKFFEGDTTDSKAETADGKTVYHLYSGLTNFKRAIFTCNASTGVVYDDTSGRIQEMIFEQI